MNGSVSVSPRELALVFVASSESAHLQQVGVFVGRAVAPCATLSFIVKGPATIGVLAYLEALRIMESQQFSKRCREAMISAIQGIDFNGVTGHQSFDSNGDTTDKIITIYKLGTNATTKKPDWLFASSLTVA